MASFLTELFSSIFTPGPTPTLITATNISFAALQAVLLALLVATYSVHFMILSCLSGFLWYAINWFVRELQAADQKEQEARKSRESRTALEGDNRADSGEETEGLGEEKTVKPQEDVDSQSSLLSAPQGDLRKRRSLGEQSSGDLSTDSEWDKVGDSEGDISGRSSQE